MLVRIRRVGLCGTDYHIFAGRHPFLAYPRVMGHELAGEIEQAPSGSAFHKGQVVAINPYLYCGTCIACRHDKPNACANIQVLGVHVDGGMCDILAVPESAVIDATGLTFDQAAMLEFLAIGAHAVSRARLKSTDHVLVTGAGPIGIATALFAQIEGAKVTLVDTRQARLDYALKNLDLTDIETAGPDLSAKLAERTAGEMFDVVFDATGALSAMAQSLAFVANGGTLVLVGVAPGNLIFDDPEFHKRETTLLASRNALSADFDRVIAAIRAGHIPFDALKTHGVQAEDLPKRIPMLIAEADNVLKAIAHF
ncbi:zinc-binding alcohol dehydrogenase family protein [Sphingomonas sp. QA11]|uniref:zinc-binding alcohol dehydrogenase family protein n=1 Tax=Sphingomonas sp. QA11 TaxID=2950605 RepID=UPI00234A0554|nr:zinc-binding alcohol dehydrogenase family protein [Sphingomonas sp. QA11]WCM28636.1 zinc-binding alcohol dehydrogenase family protein [Sphingomonas sp. QA11]